MGTTRVQLDAMNMLISYTICSTAKHLHLSFTCIQMHPFIPEGNKPQATFQPVAYSPHSQAVEPGLKPLWRHVKHPVRSLQGEMASPNGLRMQSYRCLTRCTRSVSNI